MDINKLEIAISNAISVLNEHGDSGYELSQNMSKLKKDNCDTEAFIYLKSLCTSTKGLQAIYLEKIKRDKWLDLIDAIYEALEN